MMNVQEIAKSKPLQPFEGVNYKKTQSLWDKMAAVGGGPGTHWQYNCVKGSSSGAFQEVMGVKKVPPKISLFKEIAIMKDSPTENAKWLYTVTHLH